MQMKCLSSRSCANCKLNCSIFSGRQAELKTMFASVAKAAQRAVQPARAMSGAAGSLKAAAAASAVRIMTALL